MSRCHDYSSSDHIIYRCDYCSIEYLNSVVIPVKFVVLSNSHYVRVLLIVFVVVPFFWGVGRCFVRKPGEESYV